ncbi:MAG: cobalamin-binding protein [Actinobacteria bacterium]|nr:MAG: cobalamin-binding protein [Actinomycetota bacterium]
MVFDLGLADQLRGVTVECNWPQHAKEGREIVVDTFTNSTMTPGAIDAFVKQRVAQGLDLYNLDDAAGVASRGTALTNSLHKRLEIVADYVRGLARPKVFVLEWIDPPFGAGHWVPDIIHAAGGVPVVCRPGERSVQTTWQEITDAQPDVVIVAPCGFDLDGASEQAASIINQLPNSVSVWAIDADSVMVRPGLRLVDGVEAIAAMLHGQAVNEMLLRRIRSSHAKLLQSVSKPCDMQ